ncbi:hypothetical protein BGZ61DRAFT_456231 [Ilyonectria robusta]|uniref:uncharacterized protein n=1 Tax=Ilyonectria robusta TaxID=1079257 RepID=UPI001E8D7D98|nr:uncharacterized protein BGZ61DRAFT_456231 [Ilyonectria robusta]KAH8683722.1 hypothetical protein BGZ61DRAFT_456231 [Ilyonectria robusta]
MSAPSAIPTATSVLESAVIKAPLSHVWHHIKLQDFANFWSALEKSEWVKGASPDTDIVKWTFKDGSVVDVKQEEHSTINHYITYSIISSQPELTYTSAMSTIRCHSVTSGEFEGSTYIEWSGHFSSDADAGVIQDAKFKRIEALADLGRVSAKK